MKSHTCSKGFTLIEILVAMSIFLLIMTATVEIMLIVLRTQQNITRIQALQDNARFSLELITKEMRTGVDYRIGTVCTTDGSEIHFTGTSGKRVYYLDPGGSGKIYRYAPSSTSAPDITTADQCASGTNSQFNEFTGDQVFVENLKFFLRGEKPPTLANDGQAMAIITMRIKPGLTLETTVVQRIRDLP